MNATERSTSARWHIWIRVPPSRRWKRIGDAESQAEAESRKNEAIKGFKFVDTFITEKDTNPNKKF